MGDFGDIAQAWLCHEHNTGDPYRTRRNYGSKAAVLPTSARPYCCGGDCPCADPGRGVRLHRRQRVVFSPSVRCVGQRAPSPCDFFARGDTHGNADTNPDCRHPADGSRRRCTRGACRRRCTARGASPGSPDQRWTIAHEDSPCQGHQSYPRCVRGLCERHHRNLYGYAPLDLDRCHRCRAQHNYANLNWFEFGLHHGSSKRQHGIRSELRRPRNDVQAHRFIGDIFGLRNHRDQPEIVHLALWVHLLERMPAPVVTEIPQPCFVGGQCE
jgi:hypothetical protein